MPLNIKQAIYFRKIITGEFLNRLAHSHSVNYTMDKVYMRNTPNSKELHINFRYANESLKIDRDFNLFRKLDENVDLCVARIKNNLEKEIQKKFKKKKTKIATSGDVDNLDSIQINEPNIEFSNKKSGPFNNVTFEEILKNIVDGDIFLNVLDKTYQCVYNRPWVGNIGLPAVLLSGCLAYPSKLELDFAEKELSRAKWFRTKENASTNLERKDIWTLCGEGFIYNITNDDIGCYLKLEVTPVNEKGEEGPSVHKITKSPVQEGARQYPFEKRQEFTKSNLEGSSFRVVSYNILADLYSDSEYAQNNLFPYCPKYALSSNYRRQLILKELLGYKADIICLQEVDTKIFNYDLSPVLASRNCNYAGVMAEKGSSGEGLAMFYRKDRLELLETYNQNIGNGMISLPIFQSLLEKVNKNKKLIERAADRSTTLQISLLRLKDVNQLIIIANTHLYFHPDADHIRLLQFGFCMLYLELFFKETLEKYQIIENQLGIIFCGDFNSVPECGIYKLMTEGKVESDFIDWRSNIEEAVEGVSLKQPFKIDSACGTPEYTNYTHLFAACLDYIFYQKDRYNVEQTIPLPSTEELQENTAIPSVVFPSDHVALVADLKCIYEN